MIASLVRFVRRVFWRLAVGKPTSINAAPVVEGTIAEATKSYLVPGKWVAVWARYYLGHHAVQLHCERLRSDGSIEGADRILSGPDLDAMAAARGATAWDDRDLCATVGAVPPNLKGAL
jgi:hypothetical protein